MSEEHKVCWNDSERPTIKLAREITEWYQGSPGTSKIPPWAVNLAAHLLDKGYSQDEPSRIPEQFTDAQVEAAINTGWIEARRHSGTGGQMNFGPPFEFQMVIRAALDAALKTK